MALRRYSGNFSDLVYRPGHCFRIKNTAKRAITLKQLESVVKHTAKRFGCEVQVVTGKALVYDEYNENYSVEERYAMGKTGKTNATWNRTRKDSERWVGKRPNGWRTA